MPTKHSDRLPGRGDLDRDFPASTRRPVETYGLSPTEASVNSSEAQSAANLPKMVLHVLNSPTGGAALSTLGLIAEMARRGIRSCAVCDTTGYEADQQVVADE